MDREPTGFQALSAINPLCPLDAARNNQNDSERNTNRQSLSAAVNTLESNKSPINTAPEAGQEILRNSWIHGRSNNTKPPLFRH